MVTSPCSTRIEMAVTLRCDLSERHLLSAVQLILVVTASLGGAWVSSIVWATALPCDCNLSLKHGTVL